METQRGRSEALPHLESILARLLDQRTALVRRISVISRDEAKRQDLRQMGFLSNQRTALDARLAGVSRDIATVLTIDSFFESLINITERAKKAAVPHLARALQSDDWRIRWQATQLLDVLGPDAKDSVQVEDAEQAPPLSNFSAAAEQRVALGLLLRRLISDKKLTADAALLRARVEELCAGYENSEDMVNMYLSNPQVQCSQ